MTGGQWLLMMNGASMSQFLLAFGNRTETAGHLVVDATGLTGTYTLNIRWTPENPRAALAPSPDPADVSLFTALQEQLGIKLEFGKGNVPVVAVVHIERPSENPCCE